MTCEITNFKLVCVFSKVNGRPHRYQKLKKSLYTKFFTHFKHH